MQQSSAVILPPSGLCWTRHRTPWEGGGLRPLRGPSHLAGCAPECVHTFKRYLLGGPLEDGRSQVCLPLLLYLSFPVGGNTALLSPGIHVSRGALLVRGCSPFEQVLYFSSHIFVTYVQNTVSLSPCCSTTLARFGLSEFL